MKRIGFIGVGAIARAMVEGLCDGVEDPPEVFCSPRGAAVAAELAGRYPGVTVCADNQEVADRSEIVVVSVRGEQRTEALAGLTVAADRVVLNVMAGVSAAELQQALTTDAPIVRGMPLQAVRERNCITVTYPAHPDVDALFDRLGGSLPVADEAVFDVFGGLTATTSTYFAYLATIAAWADRHGIRTEDADRFVRSLFQGAGGLLNDPSRSLTQLVGDHETPKGMNERIRETWFDAANSDALGAALDALLADVRANRLG